jgi:hypothetical protein
LSRFTFCEAPEKNDPWRFRNHPLRIIHWWVWMNQYAFQ